MSRAAFRYPGSKEKMVDDIMSRFPVRVQMAQWSGGVGCYCEPFIGGGAVAMKTLEHLPGSTSVVFGDMDFGIVCLWRAIATDIQGLLDRVEAFEPSEQVFYTMRELDGSAEGDHTEIGFRKFALHQISFSGLGAMAGGPIGGADQRGRFKVGCRWNKRRHAKQLKDQSRLLKSFDSFEVIHGDFEDSLAKVPDDGFVYLDPPYYVRGGKLYVNNMSPADHARLAGTLYAAKYEWVLSYDGCDEIRALYQWASIDAFDMIASIDRKPRTANDEKQQRRKATELVITPNRSL